MWRHLLLVSGVLLACGLTFWIAWRMGRRYKKEYSLAKQARSEWLQMRGEQSAGAGANATASVSGHVVVVNGGTSNADDDDDATVRLLSVLRDSGLLAPGISGDCIRGSLFPGDHGGADGWQGSLGGPDQRELVQRVADSRVARDGGVYAGDDDGDSWSGDDDPEYA